MNVKDTTIVNQYSLASYYFVKLDLYDVEGNPIWYAMKRNDKMIDIAVIPLKTGIDKFILDIEDAEEPFKKKLI